MGNSDYENLKQMNLAAGEYMKNDDFGDALENFSKALKFLPEGDLEAKARLLEGDIGNSFLKGLG